MAFPPSVLSSLFIFMLSATLPGTLEAQGAHSVASERQLQTSEQAKRTKAETASSKLVTASVRDLPLADVLDYVARQADVKVAYAKNLPGLRDRVSLNVKEMVLSDAFKQLLKGTSLTAVFASDGQTVVIRPDSTGSAPVGQDAKGVISGVVRDSATNEGVQGVTVLLVGAGKTVVTGSNGRFVLEGIPEGEHSLSARLLGYRSGSQRVAVSGGKTTNLTILLSPAATSLGEVVTTATGSQRRVEVPSDVVKIDAEEIRARTPVQNVTDMLEAAQVPGVLVSRASGEPGARTRIRMRGIGSISQSNDPVVIVDGIWINSGSDSLSAGRGIDDVDPESIETIELVRGPSAATLYGMDASNGVIVITTKKGRAGTTRWNLGYNYDWGQPYGKKPLFYLGYGHPLNRITEAPMMCNIRQVIDGICEQDSVVIYDPNNPLLMNEGTETNHRFNFSVDGGSDAVQYRVGLTSQSQIGARRQAPIDLIRMRLLGLRPDSEFLRPKKLDNRNISSNFTLNPRQNLNVQLVLGATQINQKSSAYDYRFRLPDAQSVSHLSLDTSYFLNATRFTNEIRPYDSLSKSSVLRMSATSNWRPVVGWSVSGTAGIDKSITDIGTYDYSTRCHLPQNQSVSTCLDTLGNIYESKADRTGYSLRFNGSTVINMGSLNRFIELRPSLGGDYRKSDNSLLHIDNKGLPAGERTVRGGGDDNISLVARSQKYANASAGWYLNTTVAVFRRLYFDLGIRQDIGSAITSTSNAGSFPFNGLPKIGSSWLVSDEPFWPANDIVGLFRLRGAIGHSAVQPDIADIRGRYVSQAVYRDSSTFVRGITLQTAPNEKLVPERSTEVEVGFDADVLYDRINLVMTYAHKENRNTIVSRNMAPSAGLGSGTRKQNIARVVNKNFEASANARVIENGNMLLIVNYALTLSDNRVASLGGVAPFGSTTGWITEGEPVGSNRSRMLMGYYDLNGDGFITNDEVSLSNDSYYVGWSQPRYRASYGVSVTYRNQITFDSRFSSRSKYAQSFLPNGRYGDEDISAPLSFQALAHHPGRGVRNVSDFRWNSASITYHVPRFLTERLRSRSLSISLMGNNLGLWTNYIGRDPSVNSALLGSGIGEGLSDNGNMIPPVRLYNLRFQWGI